MSRLKNIQYFIHKHYEPIKIILLGILIVLSVLILISIAASEGRRIAYEAQMSEERTRQLIDLANDISHDQQTQHNHQDERIACFFNLFVDYTNTRQAITDEDAKRCRSIRTSRQLTEEKQTQTQAPTPQPQSTQATQPTQESTPDAPRPASPPQVQPEPPTFFEAIVETITGAFR